MRRPSRALVVLLLAAGVLAGPPDALGRGGKPAAARAPEWTEEDGRTVVRVFSPRALKAYFAPATELAEGAKSELVVALHGHGGTATGLLGEASQSTRGRVCAVLACEGSGTVATDRGEGHSWDAADAEGVLACLDATLSKHPIDPKRVVLMGHSAGGAMSVRTHAARPAAFLGAYLTATADIPSSANKGGRFVVNLGTKDGNWSLFAGAVNVSEKTIVGRIVGVTGLEHAFPPTDYSTEALAWLFDSKAASEVLRVPLVPGDEATAPPDSPAAKAKGKAYRHVLVFQRGGRGAPEHAPDRAAAKAAATALAAEWKKATDFGDLPATKSDDPLSKETRGLVTGLVLTRYGGALATALSKLRGGDVSAPVESDAGWHVVARDPE